MANKPFSVKGMNVASPKGTALWCKIVEPDRTFNAKGTLSTDVVCDPNDPTVIAFIDKLEALRDTAFNEAKETLKPAQASKLGKKDVYNAEVDAEGNDTGMIKFRFKLDNVDDKDKGRDKIQVFDAGKNIINNVPLIGNGSVIRCAAFANPYYMANGNVIGVSLGWKSLQLISLVAYGGGASDFDEEDGYSATDTNDYDEQPSEGGAKPPEDY